jgi:hypothetical protein
VAVSRQWLAVAGSELAVDWRSTALGMRWLAVCKRFAGDALWPTADLKVLGSFPVNKAAPASARPILLGKA